ncbi:hypothetical protein [Streptomyces sp. NPDC059597]|uniref:hypothetical protein n=1 Tax=Streptomyces sp. NPDC059597 TaxID=3346879 RepID=UPI0036C142E8
MPTYHEIMSADLAALTGAAERWDAMAGEFARQEKAYRGQVYGITLAPAWSGMSAEAAHGRFGVTLGEFRSAQTEAKAIASLLRDAHAQFTQLRGRLSGVRREAVGAGLRVSDQGVVTGDGAESSVVRAWQDRIDHAVRAVSDADEGVRLALTSAVDGAGSGRGFNGAAVGDVEKYEALAAEGPLERLSRGGRLSAGELSELRREFRDNAGDEVFSRMILDDLGPAGTVRLTNELNDLLHGPRGVPGLGPAYGELESGLANSLATATRDTESSWYRHWRAGMRRAGVRHWATDAQGERLDKALGYQSLVTLMRAGHGYSGRMVEDLTDDLIAAERHQPGIWRLKGQYAGGRSGWFANDPVDGALGLMARDPATAAHYLSSDAHMRYLVKERDWSVSLREGRAGTYTPGLDGDDRAGFGAALEAGATGVSSAGGHCVPHTARNEAVLKSALHHLSAQGDDFPPSLRRPLANILVNHGPTVHAAMSEVDISRAHLPQDELFEVTKQVSKTRGAYDVLNGGLNQAMVSGIHATHSPSPEPLLRAGRTIGFLEEARLQSQGDPQTATFETKPLFDKAIGYLPVASEDVQEGFDYVTGKWLEDEQKRLDDKQSEENIKAFDVRNGQLMGLAAEWAKTQRPGGTAEFDIKAEVSRSAQDGMLHANGVSGERPR